MEDRYFAYIMANLSKTLYAGVTNDLERRVFERKNKLIPGFTSKYRIDRLVWLAETQSIEEAIYREKQIKGWLRARKVALIEADNPEWLDLAADWFK